MLTKDDQPLTGPCHRDAGGTPVPAPSDAAVELVEALSDRVDALQRALLDAENRLACRDRLDVLLAHEVRTPLTVVAGTLETLLEIPADARLSRQLVEAAVRNAQALTEIVEDLLTSRPDGGVVLPRAQLKQVQLDRVVQDALASVATAVDRRRVVCDGLDRPITTAPGRLRAVLANFLENAARYGGRGVIECWASSHAGTVRVGVSDRGPGLDGQDPEELFEPFVQGPRGQASGRGLGLYLVRLLARSLGGDAHLAERLDGGTSAWVELPQRRVEDRVLSPRS